MEKKQGYGVDWGWVVPEPLISDTVSRLAHSPVSPHQNLKVVVITALKNVKP